MAGESNSNWKKNVVFETVKGVFVGAVTGAAGISLGNLGTTQLEEFYYPQKSEKTSFAERFQQKSQSSILTATIFGAIAGAVYYRTSAKNYNKMLNEKWVVRVGKETDSSKQLPRL